MFALINYQLRQRFENGDFFVTTDAEFEKEI